MKAKFYNILSQCVETGARHGYTRAFKHVENPTEDSIVDSIETSIMNEICEYFSFDDND